MADCNSIFMLLSMTAPCHTFKCHYTANPNHWCDYAQAADGKTEPLVKNMSKLPHEWLLKNHGQLLKTLGCGGIDSSHGAGAYSPYKLLIAKETHMFTQKRSGSHSLKPVNKQY